MFLAIITRYPLLTHERAGADSYFNHGLAQSISSNGYAYWILNPLSFFGLYPYSYPSANAFLIAGISELTIFDIEYSILFEDIIFSLIAVFVSWCIAKTLFNNPVFIFLSCFFFSFMPKIIEYTYWMTSGRSVMAILFPYFILYLFKINENKNFYNKKYIFLALLILFLFIYSCTHRSFYTIFLLIPPVLVILLIEKYKNLLRIKINNVKYQYLLILLIVIIAFLLQYIMPEYFFKVQAGVAKYSKFGFFTGLPEFINYILNFIINYSGKCGIFLFMSIFCINITLSKCNGKIILGSIIILIPFLNYSEYVSIYFYSFIGIAIAAGTYHIIKKINISRRIIFLIISLILILSLIFAIYMVDRWSHQKLNRTDYDWIQEDNIFTTAIWLKEYCPPDEISSAGHLPAFIATTYAGLNSPIKYPESFRFEWNSMNEFLKKPQEPYRIVEIKYNDSNPSYFFEDIKYYGKSTYFDVEEYPLAEIIHNEKYLIYNNGYELIWFIK